jgi:alanine racemase
VITVDEIATHLGSIPWELLTSVSRRVPRFYREP